mmetsp:Transcript_23353/g.66168  ORF Transcript_23353/g.66168 Transcript_23353/m.66168 type:complete len:85 (+) Transcript_23353:478-732(+)
MGGGRRLHTAGGRRSSGGSCTRRLSRKRRGHRRGIDSCIHTMTSQTDLSSISAKQPPTTPTSKEHLLKANDVLVYICITVYTHA